MSRPISNPLALAVLSCLWQRPMYPYEITTMLRERNKEDSIRLNFGSLYAVIRTLQKHGFIEVDRIEREGNRPERVVYAITDSGVAEANEWLRDLLANPAKEYPALEAGLSLMAQLPPEEARELLQRRVEALDAEIAEKECQQRLPEIRHVPEFLMIEAVFNLEMLRAERRFVAEFESRLAQGAVGGQDVWQDIHRMLAAGRSMTEVEETFSDLFTGEEKEEQELS